jgi:radical SAM superfamily enzyme YgiQ (UPF0313 family)
MSFIRPEIIRPPSEHACYFLPLTSGCSNNSCIYCNYYGCKLQIRDLSDVKKEIDYLSSFVNQGIHTPEMPDIACAIADEWDGKRIFLQDGDALVYPYPELVEILLYLNLKFPDLERISSYATPQDINRLSVDQLRSLAKNKLGILYMGVESGDDEVLTKIGKSVTAEQMVLAGKKVKESGILLSVSVILGLGGLELSQRHAEKTAEILTNIDPDYAGALTLSLIPGTPVYQDCKTGKFNLISPFQSIQELKTIVSNATFSRCFFSSMHASNYFSIRGILPDDKAQMLAQLDYVIARKDPRLLRPEFLRGL